MSRPDPEVRVFETPEALAEAVADAFVELVGASGERRDIALTGGSISRLVHRAIAARADSVAWGQLAIWWGDERFVARDSVDRNARQAREDFLDRAAGVEGAWPACLNEHLIMEVPPTEDVRDVTVAAEVYSDLLRFEGTGGFELVFLGVGPDGHVASLFPGHPALDVEDQIATAVTDSPKPPPERVTLTLGAFDRTEHVWFIVSGADKADAVRRGLAAEGSIDETPARGVRGRASTVWWLDHAAATHLP
ncbi:MAG: 6-phosphogluconolactonase [Nocardioides sp.]